MFKICTIGKAGLDLSLKFQSSPAIETWNSELTNSKFVAKLEFVEILRDAGVPVTISGKDYQVMVSPNRRAANLEKGGFTQDEE